MARSSSSGRSCPTGAEADPEGSDSGDFVDVVTEVTRAASSSAARAASRIADGPSAWRQRAADLAEELARPPSSTRRRPRQAPSDERWTTRSRVASGNERRWTVSRIEARSWSPLCATPPPTTMSDGLKKFTMLARTSSTRRPHPGASPPPPGRRRKRPARRRPASRVRAGRVPSAAAGSRRPARPPRPHGPAHRRRPAPPGSRRVSAAADHRPVIDHLDVAHVTGAPWARDDVPVRDDPGADAGADLRPTWSWPAAIPERHSPRQGG